MTTRASIIMWSAGGGALLGLIADLFIAGLWVIAGVALPAIAPRHLPRWTAVIATLTFAAVPVLMALLGYFEGRLKAG